MICEVRDFNEVVLRNASFRDVLAVILIWLHKDREIAFSRPEKKESMEEEA